MSQIHFSDSQRCLGSVNGQQKKNVFRRGQRHWAIQQNYRRGRIPELQLGRLLILPALTGGPVQLQMQACSGMFEFEVLALSYRLSLGSFGANITPCGK